MSGVCTPRVAGGVRASDVPTSNTLGGVWAGGLPSSDDLRTLCCQGAATPACRLLPHPWARGRDVAAVTTLTGASVLRESDGRPRCEPRFPSLPRAGSKFFVHPLRGERSPRPDPPAGERRWATRVAPGGALRWRMWSRESNSYVKERSKDQPSSVRRHRCRHPRRLSCNTCASAGSRESHVGVSGSGSMFPTRCAALCPI